MDCRTNGIHKQEKWRKIMTKEELYDTAFEEISEAFDTICDADFKPYVQGIISIIYRLEDQCKDYPVMEGVH